MARIGADRVPKRALRQRQELSVLTVDAPATDFGLDNGNVVLDLSCKGGAITRCEVAGHPLFHPASSASEPFCFANFPLVPFSNRIASSGFSFAGQDYSIPPNFSDPRFPLPIHGFGWQAEWDIERRSASEVALRYHALDPAWPAPFLARQVLTLTSDGYIHSISVTNTGESAMPGGLGLHPYFPSANAIAIEAGFSARWHTGTDGLPVRRESLQTQPDWFAGEAFDCGFDWPGRELSIEWSDRRVTITADPVFGHAIVYIPAQRPFFCLEPVTHATNAMNRAGEMTTLQPGQTLAGSVRFALQVKETTFYGRPDLE